jgi:hypothetical protein
MKTFALSLALLLGLSFSLQAQEETLFRNAKLTGAFGGPFVEYGEILGQQGSMVGGGGALQFKSFFVGGYGIGTHYPETGPYVVNLRHSGLWLGYTFPSYKLFHLYASLRAGGGAIRFKEDRSDRRRDAIYSDRIQALTPELGVEVNVSDFLRISVTGGYRLIGGVDRLPASYTNEDFSGWIGGLTFRIGSF